jgi:hypothetical protein
MIMITHILNCISERASLSYIMFVLDHKIPFYTSILLPIEKADTASSPIRKTEISIDILTVT